MALSIANIYIVFPDEKPLTLISLVALGVISIILSEPCVIYKCTSEHPFSFISVSMLHISVLLNITLSLSKSYVFPFNFILADLTKGALPDVDFVFPKVPSGKVL